MLIAAAGPAIVRASSLMSIKPLFEEITATSLAPQMTFSELIETTLRFHRPALLQNLSANNALFGRLIQPSYAP